MSNRSKRVRMVYVVLAIVVAVMLAIGLRIDNWQRDWTTNEAKLVSDAGDPDLRPFELPLTSEEVEQRITEWIESKPNWSQEAGETSQGVTTIRLTRTTGLMRFTDDVTVTLVPDQGTTRIEAESRSRIGKGDLGQNPRNLKELVRGLKS